MYCMCLLAKSVRRFIRMTKQNDKKMYGQAFFYCLHNLENDARPQHCVFLEYTGTLVLTDDRPSVWTCNVRIYVNM